MPEYLNFWFVISPCNYYASHHIYVSLSLQAALVIALFFLNLLHESTYVWQSTVGNDVLTPSLRDKCEYLPAGSPVTLDYKPKVAIVVLYGGDWPSGLMQRVVENKEFYAKYHGYTLINANSFVDNSRPVAWSKLLAVEETLHRFDYVMYVDMDAIIMDLSRPIDSFIIAGEAVQGAALHCI